MPEEAKSDFIGKYVCYDAIDGGACWGRIKAEAKVNTVNGLVDVFILSGRLVRYKRARQGTTLKVGTPDDGFRTMSQVDGGKLESDLVFEVRRFNGDTILWKSGINVEKDVIDIEQFVNRVSTDDLFLAVMRGRDSGSTAKTALELGIEALCGAVQACDKKAAPADTESIEPRLKEELKKRLEGETDGQRDCGSERGNGTETP